MDYDTAMQAHATWKIKLTSYASGVSSEKLDPDMVCKDDVCPLGQWIHGDGQQVMTTRPEYSALVVAHAEFHHEAAALIRQIHSGAGDPVRAQLADVNSGYRKASSKVMDLLMGMKRASAK
jgi:methyl-accepting chemotaxis protein